MATEILIKDGTPKIWADATDWPVGGAHGFGNEDYQLDLTGVADTNARQGAKGDLGATRAARFAVRVGIEPAAAPTAGEVIEFYWSASNSATAATGNDGGASGSDAAYKNGEEDEWVAQLTYIGCLVLTADGAATVQIATINAEFIPPQRYGMPVVKNEAGQALHTDAVEMFIALIPQIDESQ